MISIDTYPAQWFGNIRGDLLSGLVVTLALIPEAIAFSIIAAGHSHCADSAHAGAWP